MNQVDGVLNTYQAVKELVGSGFAEEQAEAIVSFQVQFLNENLANKQDIALIQHDIEVLRLATQKDIKLIHKDIEVIHKDIESHRAETKKDLQLLSSQLTLRMGGMLMAAVGVLASLQTFTG